MKLLLRRDQRSGMLGGKPVFSIDVRAEISDDERATIKKYKLGETILYATPDNSGGSGLLDAVSSLAYAVTAISITVDDLTNGRKVECKNIVEMLGAEVQIKEAAKTFKAVLDAAHQFGGEEVVEL